MQLGRLAASLKWQTLTEPVGERKNRQVTDFRKQIKAGLAGDRLKWLITDIRKGTITKQTGCRWMQRQKPLVSPGQAQEGFQCTPTLG